MFANALDIWIRENFDASFPEFVGIWASIGEVIWNEGNAVAEAANDCQDLKHPERARVLIGHRQVMVDHEDVFLPRLTPEVTCQISIRRPGGQGVGPSVGERGPIQLLMALGPGGDIGPGGRAFEMNDFTQRLVKDFVALLP